MLKQVKQLLYKRIEQNTNKQILEGLKNQLGNDEDIYIVHQVGRVASMTLTNSLQSAMPDITIYHTHYLNTETLEQRREVENRLRRRITQRHFRVSELLAPVIQSNSQEGSRRWKIVTIFRDPVARNISAFYLSIEDYMPNFQQKFAQGSYTVADFIDIFLRHYSRDYAINWLDNEVNKVFKLNVYEQPFSIQSGYHVLTEGNTDLLMIKLEKLNQCIEPALKEFLGLKEIKLIDTHITKNDEKDGNYARLMAEISLPNEYLEHIYSSKFCSHFYSSEELEKFRARWIKPTG